MDWKGRPTSKNIEDRRYSSFETRPTSAAGRGNRIGPNRGIGPTPEVVERIKRKPRFGMVIKSQMKLEKRGK